MIEAEEFVVKVRADTSALGKATKELSKQIEQINKQSGSLGTTFTNIFTGKAIFDTSGAEKYFSDIDKMASKMKSKMGKRFTYFLGENPDIKNAILQYEKLSDRIGTTFTKGSKQVSYTTDVDGNPLAQYDLNQIKEKYKINPDDLIDFQNTDGESLVKYYDNQFEAILENFNKFRARELEQEELLREQVRNAQMITTASSGEVQDKKVIAELQQKQNGYIERSIELNRKNEALNEFMTKTYGKKWTDLRDAQYPSDVIDKYTQKADKLNGKESGFSKRLKMTFKRALLWAPLLKLLSSLIKLISEGFGNVYQYSKKFGTNLSGIVDSFNSKKSALANSLGAFVTTFVEALAPVFTQIMGWLTDIINRLTKVVAELFNLPEYYVANKDIFAEWKSNIEETKELIQGFDELNFFSQKSNNSGIEDMFTVVKRDTKERNGLTDLFNSIGRILEKIDWDSLEESLFNLISALDSLLIVLVPIVEALLDLFEPLLNFITTFVTDVTASAVDALAKFIGFITGQYDFSEFSKALIKAFTAGWEDIKKAIRKALGLPEADETKHKDTVVDIIADAYNEKTGSNINPRSPVINSKGEQIITPFSDPIGGDKYNFDTNTGNPAKDLVNAVKNDVGNKGFFGSILYDIGRVGGDLWNMLTPDSWSKYDDDKWQEATNFGVRRNAKGGVYTKPTYGLVGEYAGASNNPELITPKALMLDTMSEANGELINIIAQCTRQVVSAISDKDTSITIGDETIARANQRGITKLNKLYGI